MKDADYGDCSECHGFGIAYLDGTNEGHGKAGVLCPVCDGSGLTPATPEGDTTP